MPSRTYYVYILASVNSRAIYVGMTNDIKRRIFEHKTHHYPDSHSAHYKIHKLMYYETFPCPYEAIAREKQLKNWKRQWKIELFEQTNPGWEDLAINWYDGL